MVVGDRHLGPAKAEAPTNSVSNLLVLNIGVFFQDLGQQGDCFPIHAVSVELTRVVDDAIVFIWSSVGGTMKCHGCDMTS